jgi:deoxyadenosine/deoxycytidine kinase
MICLHISVDEAIRRIQKRGREYEQIVDRLYWENLNARYVNFFNEYLYSPLITIDVSNLDFENNPDDKKVVVDLINNQLNNVGSHFQLKNQALV